MMKFLEKNKVHGFDKSSDKTLAEDAAYAIAKWKLGSRHDHKLIDVTQTKKQGYDIQCGHCSKVFEVKGMSEINDIHLEESEVLEGNQRTKDYVLVVVYNLLSFPVAHGYKEISNPIEYSRPMKEAIFPKDKLLECKDESESKPNS
jgi:hypothetical protein